MAKFNKKSTKKEMGTYLSDISATMENTSLDENLQSRVKYTVEHLKSALHTDLLELANEVFDALAPATVTTAPVEASLKKPEKKTLKAPNKKPEPVEEPEDETDGEDDDSEEVEEEAETEAEEVEEKPAPKKSTGKSKNAPKGKTKTNAPKEEIQTLPAASNVGIDNLPQATMFPSVIEHEDLGKLVACTGMYTTYAEIFEALEADKTLYFAGYWTKRHIKEFRYSEIHSVKAPKNGFPHDLDIAMAVVPCETVERVYAMSRYTEAMYRFEGEDFQYLEDTDPRSGKKFRIRVSAGMEFEIYAPADEMETEKPAESTTKGKKTK